MTDALMTYQEAAQYLRTSVDALRHRVQQGSVPYIRFGPRTVRFDPEELRRGKR